MKESKLLVAWHIIQATSTVILNGIKNLLGAMGNLAIVGGMEPVRVCAQYPVYMVVAKQVYRFVCAGLKT